MSHGAFPYHFNTDFNTVNGYNKEWFMGNMKGQLQQAYISDQEQR